MEDSARIDKFLANNGVCARRQVEELLTNRIVTINGKRVKDPGERLIPHLDTVRMDGTTIKQPDLVYFLINKPKGYVSTTQDKHAKNTVISLIPTALRIYPVGRLDKETSGLLILTNDGEFTNLLTHPKFHINKTYKLSIKGLVSEDQLNALKNGVELEDGITAPANARTIESEKGYTTIVLTIHEGRNRQIRRMCEVLGIDLIELERIQIGDLKDDSLKVGKFRELTSEEIIGLKRLLTDK